LHTLASAVLVKARGGNAATGAAGGFVAASGSAALSLAFYNKKPEKLSPNEKTVIANLVAAPGAASGSMAAGNSTGIGSGANAARVEVENNSVGCDQRMCAAQGSVTNSCTGAAQLAVTCLAAAVAQLLLLQYCWRYLGMMCQKCPIIREAIR